jgi:hypothetical protein
MSEEAAKPIFEQFKEELLGGIVTDFGVSYEARQPWLSLIVVEKDGKKYWLTFDSAPKINGGY